MSCKNHVSWWVSVVCICIVLSQDPPDANLPANEEHPVKTRKGFSVKILGLVRSADSKTNLTVQADFADEIFWMGQEVSLDLKNSKITDGAESKRKKRVKAFSIDKDPVSVAQFRAFISATKYITEAEQFGWSFVFEDLASQEIINNCERRLGRVKDAPHWLGVEGADWRHPEGPDSSVIKATANHPIASRLDYPVTHISFNDAVEYCTWAGLRLPLESEWELAARGGLVNQSYPWGSSFEKGRMNIWEGEFGEARHNTLEDGYLGVAPLDAYPPQTPSGMRHMLGNVWEWVQGGTTKKRILRGGSFIDSEDGKFNHIVLTSTRQINTADSTANNIGFRCAKGSTVPTKSGVKDEGKNFHSNKDGRETGDEQKQRGRNSDEDEHIDL